MTRTPAQWRQAAFMAERRAESALDRAARDDFRADTRFDAEDSLVGDALRESATRQRQDADEWRDRAAVWLTYADDAELPETVTVRRAS